MNHCVPRMDDSASGLPRHQKKKPSIAEQDTVELLWQNGQVVTHTQNQRQLAKSPPLRNSDDSPSSARPEVENYNQFLFMQEGEMASWLHCPIEDLDQTFCADFLNPPPTVNNNNTSIQTPPRTSQLTELGQLPMHVAPAQPPIPPPKKLNFACFSAQSARVNPGPSSISRTTARESTGVESCDTPAVPTPVVSETARSSEGGVAAPSTTFDCEPGGSSSSGEPAEKVEEQDRKRKGREVEEWEYQSEDVYIESAEAKKNAVGSTSTKRSRAAEVHNLSERRRRDRINEKMRALQELIPRCNKSDKASMLDEAIEYLKSLQLQVQMMSMGCGVVPMMFPGIQQYMPTMGIRMGMGMEMGMGMNRPVMSFPNMLAGSAFPAAAHLGPRFAMPPFHMPHVPTPVSSGMQVANRLDNVMHPRVGTPDPNQSHIPNFIDPYQQYLGPHQMQFQLMQNQAMNQQNVDKPSIP